MFRGRIGVRLVVRGLLVRRIPRNGRFRRPAVRESGPNMGIALFKPPIFGIQKKGGRRHLGPRDAGLTGPTLHELDRPRASRTGDRRIGPTLYERVDVASAQSGGGLHCECWGVHWDTAGRKGAIRPSDPEQWTLQAMVMGSLAWE